MGAGCAEITRPYAATSFVYMREAGCCLIMLNEPVISGLFAGLPSMTRRAFKLCEFYENTEDGYVTFASVESCTRPLINFINRLVLPLYLPEAIRIVFAPKYLLYLCVF